MNWQMPFFLSQTMRRFCGARRRRRISVDAMAGEEGPDLPPPSDGGVGYWLRANMAPRSNPPNPRRDLEYFSFLYAAAAAGHPEAQVRLGYLSLSYRAFVECYFWLSLARARGISEVEEPLADCREAWISAGYPGAEDSLSRNFDAGQAAVGLAMLDIDTGRDVERGVFALTEQEMAGNPAAIRSAAQNRASSFPATISFLPALIFIIQPHPFVRDSSYLTR